MTDKEIIIDVNKCKYRDTYSNFCLAEKNNIGECYTICTGNDCYYKQLQRKTEECKRLKFDNDYQVGALEMTIDKLKAEYEELKEELQISKDDHAYAVELEKEIDRYMQALEKIEGILSNHNEPGYSFCDTRCQLILDILNEVKESSTSNNVDKKAP